MKIDWQWPAAIVFAVVFVTLGALVYFGRVQPEALGALLAWLAPSPYQTGGSKPPSTPPSVPRAPLMTFALVALAACIGCIALGVLSVACSPAATPREQARSVVLATADGVRQADEACAAVARARADLALAEGCAAAVTEARSALLVAESTIDAWDAASANKPACAVQSAAAALSRILDSIQRHGGGVPPAATDALRLAPLLAGACHG